MAMLNSQRVHDCSWASSNQGELKPRHCRYLPESSACLEMELLVRCEYLFFNLERPTITGPLTSKRLSRRPGVGATVDLMFETWKLMWYLEVNIISITFWRKFGNFGTSKMWITHIWWEQSIGKYISGWTSPMETRVACESKTCFEPSSIKVISIPVPNISDVWKQNGV